MADPFDTKEYHYARRMKRHCAKRANDIPGVLDCYVGVMPTEDHTIGAYAIYLVVADETTEKAVRRRLRRVKSIPIMTVRNNLLEKSQRVAQAYSKAFFAVEGVNGHGIGLTREGKPGIHIMTETEEGKARAQEVFGNELEGVPLEYMVVGRITAF